MATSLLPYPDDYNFRHPPSIPCGEENVDLSYQVPLPPHLEERALRLYRESPVILAHTHCVEPWDFEEMLDAGITAVVVKVDVDGINIVNGKRTEAAPDDWFARGTRAMRRMLEMAAQPDSKIRIVRAVEELDHARRENKVGVILSFEGGRPLVGKLENLKYFCDLGMREMQLWWAVPNELKTQDGTRLTPFGEEVIREMNRLGILIDLSHITSQAFAQAMEASTQPVVISHCAVGSLYEEPVTESGEVPYSGTDLLNDATIRAMATNGGLICLHFVTPDYIRARHGTSKATVEDLVDHAVYIRDLVGIDYLALGPDYFPEGGWQFVEGAGRMKLLPNVVREMVRRDFTDQEIEKFLGLNLLRIYEEVWER